MGWDRELFVNTCIQALATCQDLLRIKLDIKMQLVIMHLSSQIEQLREFLDREAKYQNYPSHTFPLYVPS
jgi:hypothetical protein